MNEIRSQSLKNPSSSLVDGHSDGEMIKHCGKSKIMELDTVQAYHRENKFSCKIHGWVSYSQNGNDNTSFMGLLEDAIDYTGKWHDSCNLVICVLWI